MERNTRSRSPSLSLLVSLAGLCLWLLSAAGCGSQEPFAMQKVSGKITYDDGTLIPSEGNYLRLTFYPQTPSLDSKTHPRPATAEVNLKDGTFSSPQPTTGETA